MFPTSDTRNSVALEVEADSSGPLPGSSEASGGENAQARKRRRRDWTELFIAYTLIAAAVWTPLPWQRWLSLAALLFVIFATWRSFDGWRAMGFRVVNGFRGFWRAGWVIAVALVLTAASASVAAWLHTLHSPPSLPQFAARYWSYSIWAFLQEFLLLNFFLLRLMRLMPTPWRAAIAATLLFALMHLPSPILTPLTFIWGLAACLIFLRYRNIYIPAIAHAIFGICIAITVPGPVDHNMRVGLGYLTYHQHGHRHSSTFTGTKSTTPYPQ